MGLWAVLCCVGWLPLVGPRQQPLPVLDAGSGVELVSCGIILRAPLPFFHTQCKLHRRCILQPLGCSLLTCLLLTRRLCCCRTEAMNRVAELGIAVDTWAPPPCTALPPVNGTATGLSNGSLRRQSAAAANGAGPARQQQQQQPPGNGRGQMAVPFLGSLMQWASSYSSFSGGSSSDDEGITPSSASAGEAAAAAAMAQQQQQQMPGGGRSTGGNSLQRLDPATMTRRINWLNSIRKWQEEFVGTLTGGRGACCCTSLLEL